METRSIGKSVPRKEGRDKVTGYPSTSTISLSRACCTALPFAAPCRAAESATSNFQPAISVGRIHHRHRRGHSRRELRRAHRRRPALPRRRVRQSSRRAGGPARASGQISGRKSARAPCSSISNRCPPFSRWRIRSRSANHLGRRQHLQDASWWKKAMSMRFGATRRTSSRASIEPARRSSSTSRPTA